MPNDLNRRVRPRTDAVVRCPPRVHDTHGTAPGRNRLAIDSFVGAFAFLHPCFASEVYWDSRMFPCLACALCAARFDVNDEQIEALAASIASPDINDGGDLNEFHRATKAVKELICSGTWFDGSKLEERETWSFSKRLILEKLLRDKFRRDIGLRQRLTETGSRQIIHSEGKDINKVTTGWEFDPIFKYFEPCHSSDTSSSPNTTNIMGKILMDIRQNIASREEFESWMAVNMETQTNSSLRPSVSLIETKPPDPRPLGLHSLEVDQSLWLIGKAEQCAIRSQNPTVSRRHALLFVRRDGAVCIVDLKSTVGTTVNGKQIQVPFVALSLHSGDLLQFGASTRIYRLNIDTSRITELLLRKKQKLEQEIKELSHAVAGGTDTESTKVCVQNLTFTTSKLDLVDYFEPCGAIKEVFLPPSKSRPDADGNKATRGTAFITFETPMGAKAALEKHECFLNGRKIKVVKALQQPR